MLFRSFLLMGNKVRIPSLGTFYLSIAADPIDDYNANPKNIHVRKLNLIPSRGFARAMKSAVFSRRHLMQINPSQNVRIENIRNMFEIKDVIYVSEVVRMNSCSRRCAIEDLNLLVGYNELRKVDKYYVRTYSLA